MNPTASPYRFLAFEVSYFSAKVRPALRYKQLWYEERHADIQEILKRTGLGFIPVLVTPDDETWQDTSEILDRLEERHPDPPLAPRTPLQRMAAHLVELYVDEFALLPAMHYRWGSARGEADARARFSAMTGSIELGNRAADRMAKARLALGATDTAAPAIEAHTHDLLDALSAHFEAHAYLLGERMSLADCALMGPLYAHLYNDIVPRALLLERAIPVVGWIERCNYPNADHQGEWLADDALAPSLIDVLGAMGRDAAPAIVASIRHIEAWCDAHPEERAEPPRGVGGYETLLRDVPLRPQARPYSLWMLQRTLDAAAALDATGLERVEDALVGTGWDELLAYRPRYRMDKRGFQLACEPV